MKSHVPSILIAALLLSVPVHADEEGGEKFEEHKKQAISNFDARIAALNDAKSCASAASNGEALKACHDKLKAAHEAIAEKAIDSKIERLQKRKAEMKAKKGH